MVIVIEQKQRELQIKLVWNHFELKIILTHNMNLNYNFHAAQKQDYWSEEHKNSPSYFFKGATSQGFCYFRSILC